MPARLRFAWRHTWPEGGHDFTASLPGYPQAFLRIYRHSGAPDRQRQWFWVASSGTGCLGSDLTPDKASAALAAEECWLANSGKERAEKPQNTVECFSFPPSGN